MSDSSSEVIVKKLDIAWKLMDKYANRVVWDVL